MKQPILIILLICLSYSSFSTNKTNSYRWMQYGIEILTEENLNVTEADLTQFRCDGDESNLWLKKLNSYLPPDVREEFLKQSIERMGYQLVGKIKTEMVDSVIIYSARAQSNKNYGYYFLFADTLVSNNLFSGTLTTGIKPSAYIQRNLEIKLFPADLSFKETKGKSTSTPQSTIDLENNMIKERSILDSIIIGKEQVRKRINEIISTYSPGVNLMHKTYYGLPEKLGARKIGEHIDFARYISDTINIKTMYLNSDFVHEMLHNINGWLSTQQSIKKTRGNYTDKIYSYYFSDTCIIDVERFSVPAANIIHKNFPQQYKTGKVYSLYIYPSALNIHTQINGIYALMDEFSANTRETEWYNDILQFYYDNQMTNANFFAGYLANSTGYFYNCICFKFYILHYLLTIKSISPEIYTKLMDNINFRKTISYQCKDLNNEIKRFNSRKIKISEELGNEYIRFIETDEKLTINDIAYKNDELAKLNKMIGFINEQPEYQKISSELGCEVGLPIVMIKE
jgi:hypothetical protein